jgi:hypothetical protein
MLIIFTIPPPPTAKKLKTIEIIARIMVITQVQPFALNKPHANRKHAIPIAIPIAAVIMAIVIIVSVIEATSCGDISLLSVRLKPKLTVRSQSMYL